MLRSLFAIIVLSFFVTPVFASSNIILPKMYSEEEFKKLPQSGISYIPDQNQVIVSAKGSSTSSAICMALGYLADYIRPEKGDRTVRLYDDFTVTTGSMSSSKTNREKNGIKRKVKHSYSFQEIKRNKSYLNCRSKSEKKISFNSVIGKKSAVKSTTKIIERNLARDSDSSTEKISVTSLQSDTIKVLEYGIKPPSLGARLGDDQVWIILVISITL